MNLYRTIEEYTEIKEALVTMCGLFLFEFDKESDLEVKDIMLRNFLAKSLMSLKGVFVLWGIKNYQDCWAIYRAQMDRLFHLEHIANRDEFQLFDDWSIYKQAQANNLAKSDKRFSCEQTSEVYSFDNCYADRVKSLLKSQPKWVRPKAEKVAKEMGMDFLYKFGYDLASMHVHPMSNDGQQDYFTVTGIEPSVEFPTQIAVVHNSILTTTMIAQNVFNYSSLRWRKLLWDFIDQIRDAINTGNKDYMITYLKIAELARQSQRLAAKDI
ncbi:DUF5677 domain-containing protein [Vibrio splendidus]|uniref:Uncharacterized protein n=1 Tax=Vibrio splendidus 12E03 TaxID=1191305 RepID=A0A1E5FVZ6_VIBSP|nr:DUF5677 domain-containing protein [Vibrio splendidus]OEF94667.1 hypothetical protein A142_16340 [Vibrio splendidus 12E03]PHX07624.1 hypothetical protein VSPL_05620 [Vibrio splendidus]